MSNALVVAAVTAIVKNLLENALVHRGVSATIGNDAFVSAVPPDRIKLGDEEKAQLNVYLYRMQPRGLDWHSQAVATAEGRDVAGWELSYLVTAYGAEDLHGEILLGHALDVLQEHATISHEEVAAILRALSSTHGGKHVSSARAALGEPSLVEVIQDLKLAPVQLRHEEMMQLWSMLHATYRPAFVFRAKADLCAPTTPPSTHDLVVSESASNHSPSRPKSRRSVVT